MSEAKPAEAPKAPAAAAPAAPTAAKPEETEKATEEAVAADSSGFVGKRIAKKFSKKNYFGEIKEKWTEEKDSSSRWHIKYDDGDEEDFSEKEVESGLKQYEKAKRFDYKIFPKKPRAPRKKRKVEPPPARTNKFPKRGVEKND